MLIYIRLRTTIVSNLLIAGVTLILNDMPLILIITSDVLKIHIQFAYILTHQQHLQKLLYIFKIRYKN